MLKLQQQKKVLKPQKRAKTATTKKVLKPLKSVRKNAIKCWWYYSHWSRDSVSPVCRIFVVGLNTFYKYAHIHAIFVHHYRIKYYVGMIFILHFKWGVTSASRRAFLDFKMSNRGRIWFWITINSFWLT